MDEIDDSSTRLRAVGRAVRSSVACGRGFSTRSSLGLANFALPRSRMLIPYERAPAFPNWDALPILGQAASPPDFQVRGPNTPFAEALYLSPSRAYVPFRLHP